RAKLRCGFETRKPSTERVECMPGKQSLGQERLAAPQNCDRKIDILRRAIALLTCANGQPILTGRLTPVQASSTKLAARTGVGLTLERTGNLTNRPEHAGLYRALPGEPLSRRLARLSS